MPWIIPAVAAAATITGSIINANKKDKANREAKDRLGRFEGSIEDELYGFQKQKGAGYEMLKTGFRGQGKQLMSQAKSYKDPSMKRFASRGAQKNMGMSFGDVYQKASLVEASRRNTLLGMKGGTIGARHDIDSSSPWGDALTKAGSAIGTMGTSLISGGDEDDTSGKTSGMSGAESEYMNSPGRGYFNQENPFGRPPRILPGRGYGLGMSANKFSLYGG